MLSLLGLFPKGGKTATSSMIRSSMLTLQALQIAVQVGSTRQSKVCIQSQAARVN